MEHWANFYFADVPYKVRGRNLDIDGGLDCWGLVYDAKRRFEGVELPIYSNAPNAPELVEIADFMRGESSCFWKRVDEPKEFDVVWLLVYGRPGHVGLMIDSRDFISMTPHGVVRRSRQTWRRRIEGVYRYVG